MTSTPEGPHGYTLWAVFSGEGESPRTLPAAARFDDAVAAIALDGVVLRGIYDVSGMREDADLMLWLHGPVLQDLQRGCASCAGPACSPGSSAPGPPSASTARPSSAPTTCRRSCGTPSRSRGSPSIRSCGPTTGTCCRPRSAARCCATTA